MSHKTRRRKCPTPEKVKYPSYEAAIRAIRAANYRRLAAPIRAYRCKSHYHLTSKVSIRGRG